MITTGISQRTPTLELSEVQQIFGANDDGCWYVIGPHTCFQDSARTIAAGEGDPVAGIIDLSGRGNHGTQNQGGNVRPILRREGALWYLDFDGSNDYIDTHVTPNTGQADRYLAMGTDPTPDTSRVLNHLIHGGNNAGLRAYGLCNRVGNQDRLGNHYWASSHVTTIPATERDVYTVELSSGTNTYRALSAELTTTEGVPQLLDVSSNINYRLFARVNLGIEWARGRMYCAFILDRVLTETEQIALDTEMMRLTGVTAGGGNSA